MKKEKALRIFRKAFLWTHSVIQDFRPRPVDAFVRDAVLRVRVASCERPTELLRVDEARPLCERPVVPAREVLPLRVAEDPVRPFCELLRDEAPRPCDVLRAEVDALRPAELRAGVVLRAVVLERKLRELLPVRAVRSSSRELPLRDERRSSSRELPRDERRSSSSDEL